MIAKKQAIFYIFGFIFLLTFKLGFVVYSELSRSVPVELDDSYIYVTSAAIKDKCSQDECAGLDNLSTKISNNNPDHLKQRELASRGLYSNKIIFHENIARLLKKLNFDYLKTITLLKIVGSLSICLAIFMLHLCFFSGFVSFFSMTVIGMILFQGQGLILVVPSNIALSFSIISLCCYSKKSDSLAGFFMALSLITHPVGMLYSCIIVACSGIDLLVKRSRLSLVTMIKLLIIFICYLVYYYLNPIDVSFYNIVDKKSIVEDFLINFHHGMFFPWYFIAISSVGLICYFRKEKQILSLAFLFLSVGMFLSLFHSFSAYPGELFKRLVVLWTILAVPMLFTVLEVEFNSGQKLRYLLLMMVAVLFFPIINKARIGLRGFLPVVNKRIERHNYANPSLVFSKLDELRKKGVVKNLCIEQYMALRAYIVEAKELNSRFYYLPIDKNKQCDSYFILNDKYKNRDVLSLPLAYSQGRWEIRLKTLKN